MMKVYLVVVTLLINETLILAGVLKPLHEHLTKRDLRKIFRVSNHDEVPSYDAVNIVEHREKRNFDSESEYNGRILVIKTRTTKYIILLKPNEYLVHNDLKENEHVRDALKCVYQGIVISPEYGGNAAFSNCDGQGFHGQLAVPEGRIRISPVPKYAQDEYRGGDSIGPEYHFVVKDNDKEMDSQIRDNIFKHLRLRRQVSATNFYMELNVKYDNTFESAITNQAERITSVLSVVNQAQLLFLHSSLGKKIYFTVKKIGPLTDSNVNPGGTNDIKIYLDAFCASQQSLDVDMSVLFTGTNLQADGQRGVIGMAFVSGSCDSKYRCTVVERASDNSDETTGNILAHEIGHAVGMGHDSSEKCNLVGIMGAVANNVRLWSDCSRDFLTQYLTAESGQCLEKLPSMPVIDNRQREPLIGRVAMDALCDFQEKGSTVNYATNPCSQLTCNLAGGGTKVVPIRGISGMRCDSGESDIKVCDNTKRCVPLNAAATTKAPTTKTATPKPTTKSGTTQQSTQPTSQPTTEDGSDADCYIDGVYVCGWSDDNSWHGDNSWHDDGNWQDGHSWQDDNGHYGDGNDEGHWNNNEYDGYGEEDHYDSVAYDGNDSADCNKEEHLKELKWYLGEWGKCENNRQNRSVWCYRLSEHCACGFEKSMCDGPKPEATIDC